MQIHTGEKITCAICGQSFTNTATFKFHNWKFHNPHANQHPCGTCGRVYVSSTELKRHLESHLPDDPQECPICGKNCGNGLALKGHVERHSRQESGKCEYCLKNFKTKSTLKFLIKTIHGGSNRNYLCTFCRLKFWSPGELADHLKTHIGGKPFKCTICSKALATRKGLQTHSKVHTGENLEECQFCGQKFTWLASLTQHIRTHTGETPYKCGKAYRRFLSLGKHMTAAHPGEASDHADTDEIVPMEPMTDPSKNTQRNDPLAEVVEPSRQLYLAKGFDLRQLSIPIQRMKLKDAGSGFLELRSGRMCWYVCSKCGLGSKSILIRSHTLLCEVHQSNNPINRAVQTIL